MQRPPTIQVRADSLASKLGGTVNDQMPIVDQPHLHLCRLTVGISHSRTMETREEQGGCATLSLP